MSNYWIYYHCDNGSNYVHHASAGDELQAVNSLLSDYSHRESKIAVIDKIVSRDSKGDLIDESV